MPKEKTKTVEIKWDNKLNAGGLLYGDVALMPCGTRKVVFISAAGRPYIHLGFDDQALILDVSIVVNLNLRFYRTVVIKPLEFTARMAWRGDGSFCMLNDENFDLTGTEDKRFKLVEVDE